MDDFTLKRGGEAAQRYAERKRREDEAPRLKDEVPQLRALHLEVDERREGSIVGTDGRHIRRIVLEHAPALFIIPCGDPHCRDGGYDVTNQVMRGLHAGATRFESQDSCSGTIGSASCSRVLRFVAVATFAGAETP